LVNKLTIRSAALLVGLSLLILNGCSGGSGSNGAATGNANGAVSSTNNAYGTAATGAAMAGAAFIVTKITDGSQAATGVVDSNGLYQLNLAPTAAPYIIAVTYDEVEYQSIILASDLTATSISGTVGTNINVTPLTN